MVFVFIEFYVLVIKFYFFKIFFFKIDISFIGYVFVFIYCLGIFN